MRKKRSRSRKKNEPLASCSPCLSFVFFFPLSNCEPKQAPTSVFICFETRVWCRYAPLTGKIDEKQRKMGACGALFFVLDNGDGFFDRSMFFLSLSIS